MKQRTPTIPTQRHIQQRTEQQTSSTSSAASIHAPDADGVPTLQRFTAPQRVISHATTTMTAQPIIAPYIATTGTTQLVFTPTINIPKPSYASIVQKLNIPQDGQQKAMQALAFFNKRWTGNSQQLTRIYVQGVPRAPIRELKDILRDLRFRITSIIHISFLGKATCEFLVQAGYADAFKKRIATLESCKVVEKFDPTVAADDFAPLEVKEAIKLAFIRRVSGIITNSRNDIVKKSYSEWLTALNIPLPTTNVPEETNVIHQTAEITPVINEAILPQHPTIEVEMRNQGNDATPVHDQMEVEPTPLSGPSIAEC